MRDRPFVIPLEETVNLVRRRLRDRFPKTRFTLEPGRRGRTSWILVTWEDGLDVYAVREATREYEGMRFSWKSGRRRRVTKKVNLGGLERRVTYEPATIPLYRALPPAP
jgi:hypothetical protein